jgi:hypothetical protein
LQIFLEIVVTQFVGRFVLTVVLRVFLDCVVRQMHILIFYLLWVVFFAACPQVPVFIDKTPQCFRLLVCGEESQDADVKLTLVDQQWVLHVLLQNEVLVAALSRVCFQSLNLEVNVTQNFLKVIEDSDSVAPIRETTRFVDPHLRRVVPGI